MYSLFLREFTNANLNQNAYTHLISFRNFLLNLLGNTEMTHEITTNIN